MSEEDIHIAVSHSSINTQQMRFESIPRNAALNWCIHNATSINANFPLSTNIKVYMYICAK